MDSFGQDQGRYSPPLFVALDEMEDDDYEPMFVDPESVLQRATDSDGRSFPTVCFNRPHLEHPHHHRLICGHDVVTPKIEACGATCSMTKDQKASGQGFQCPHPECRKFASHFIQKRGASKPRVCTLSHVYGLDTQADAERREAKRILTEAKSGRMETRSGSVLLPRNMARVFKRSPSPVDAPAKGPRRSKRITNVDIGDQLNRDLTIEPGFGDLMQLTRGRAKSHRFKTDKEVGDEVEMAVLNRNFDKSVVASKEERLLRSRKLGQIEAEDNRLPSDKVEAFNAADNELQLSFVSICAYCTEPIRGMRHHCFDCEDYDLCQSCFDAKGLFPRHSRHPFLHRFKALDNPHDRLLNSATATQASFCVCGSTSTSFLVLCEDCEIPFHPGCMGIGAYDNAEHQMDHIGRGGCMKQDYLNWRGGKLFRCKECKKNFNDSKADNTRELRIIERAKKRQEMMAKGIQLSPKETVLKKRGAEEMADSSEAANHEDDTPSPFAKRSKTGASKKQAEKKLDSEGGKSNGGSFFGGMEASSEMGQFSFVLPMRFK